MDSEPAKILPHEGTGEMVRVVFLGGSSETTCTHSDPILSTKTHEEIICCSTSISTETTGLGAGHQTGWTGFIAKQIQFFGLLDARSFLERGRSTGIFYPEVS